MGRVFSYQEIEQSLLPQPEDFAEAVADFQSGSQRLVSEEIITGSFVFGSAAIGTTTIRSDFDVLFALNGDDTESYAAVRQVAHNVVKLSGYTIAIEPIIQTAANFASANHELDRLFGQHLLGKGRLIVGKDPAYDMQFPSRSTRQVLGEYLTHKRRRLSNAFFATGAESANGRDLQRVFELPKAVGRKTLQALADVSQESFELNTADPAAVMPAIAELMERNNLLVGFIWLCEQDKAYDIQLKRAIGKKIDAAAYYTHLARVRSSIPQAIQWLDKVGRTILPQLPGE